MLVAGNDIAGTGNGVTMSTRAGSEQLGARLGTHG